MAIRHANAFGHLPGLRDAMGTRDTDGKLPVVSARTTVMLVRKLQPDLPYDQQLRALSNVTSSIPCKLKIRHRGPWRELGTKMPLRMQFANMSTYPAIRILVRLPDRPAHCKIDLMWDASPETKDHGIQQFVATQNDDLKRLDITFSFKRTIVSGLRNVEKTSKLSSAQREDLHSMVRDLRALTRLQAFIEFDHVTLTAQQWQDWRRVIDYLPNGRKELLPSLQLGNNAAGYALLDYLKTESNIFHTYRMLDLYHPCTPLKATHAFVDLEHYVSEHFATALFSYREKQAVNHLVSRKLHHAKSELHQRRYHLTVAETSFKDRASPDQLTHRFTSDQMVKVEIRGFSEPVRHTSRRTQEDGYQAIVIDSPSNGANVDRIVFQLLYKPENAQLLAAFDDNAELDVRITPHPSTHEFTARRHALARMLVMGPKAWYTNVLLNKQVVPLPNIDPLAHVDPSRQRQATEWSLSRRQWNTEQRAAVEAVSTSKDRVNICSGGAGTGKTEVALAHIGYFAICGLKVLVITPTNSNIDYLCSRFKEAMQEHPFHPRGKDSQTVNQQLKFGRLHPNSWQVSATDIPPEESIFRHRGHSNNEATTAKEFLFVLAELRTHNGRLRNGRNIEESCDVTHQVVTRCRWTLEALKAEFDDIGPWSRLQRAYEKFTTSADTYTYSNDELDEEFVGGAFAACKAQLIASLDIIFTTSANAGCVEIRQYFAARPEDEWVLLADEAGKDLEINIAVPLYQSRKQPRVVWLYGDTKQLPPVNTCNQKGAETHPYNARLCMSLQKRLEDTGFPCWQLIQQTRCQTEIATALREVFYGNAMRFDNVRPSTNVTFEGLDEALGNVIGVPVDGGNIRFRWLQFHGNRTYHEKSAMVEEHVNYFFDIIFPALRAYFAQRLDTIAENVMILCSYRYTLNTYRNRLRELNLPENERPMVLTVDSAQGDEASIVFWDTAIIHRDAIGFLNEEGRVCAGMSRGREVQWTFGGAMELSGARLAPVDEDIEPQHNRLHDVYQYCERKGRITDIPRRGLAFEPTVGA